MALDQGDLLKRMEAGCTARIERSGSYVVVVVDGPAPSGVVCFRDKPKEFPSWKHAADWLASLGVSVSPELGRVGVSLRDVVDALDITPDEATSYVNRLTGEVRTVTHEYLRLAEEDGDVDLLEWEGDVVKEAKEVLESEDWLELPSKAEIREWDIMDRFGGSLPPKQEAEVRDAIRGKGAFRSFKVTIRRLGIEEAWFDHKRRALEDFARRWLESHHLSSPEDAG